MILGILALLAYLAVGVLIPLAVSKAGGDDGMRFRTKSGELGSFVLDSLRGLSEILQYGQGQERMRQMNHRTDELSKRRRTYETYHRKKYGDYRYDNPDFRPFDAFCLFDALSERDSWI